MMWACWPTQNLILDSWNIWGKNIQHTLCKPHVGIVLMILFSWRKNLPGDENLHLRKQLWCFVGDCVQSPLPVNPEGSVSYELNPLKPLAEMHMGLHPAILWSPLPFYVLAHSESSPSPTLLHTRAFNSELQEVTQDPRVGISSQHPGDMDAAVRGPHLENHLYPWG